MAIVQTEIESVHGVPPQQLVFYRCQDDQGMWHTYGPVVVNNANFDMDAHKEIVAAKVQESLASAEIADWLGE